MGETPYNESYINLLSERFWRNEFDYLVLSYRIDTVFGARISHSRESHL